HRAGVRTGRAEKARAMAGQELDRLSDPSATEQERQRRKRRLLKGAEEVREVRSKRGKKGRGRARCEIPLPSASILAHLTVKASWSTSPASRIIRLHSRPSAPPASAGPALPSPCGKVRE